MAVAAGPASALAPGPRPRHARSEQRHARAETRGLRSDLTRLALAVVDALTTLLAAVATRLRRRQDALRRDGVGPVPAPGAAPAAAEESAWPGTFQVTPIAMAKVGLDGRLLEVNDSFRALAGERGDLRNQRLTSLVHPEDLPALAGAGHPARSRGVARTDLRLVRADGRVRWCEVSSVLVRDDGGRPLHVLVHALDITDRKRSEDALRHLASRDALTGLRNRRSFEAELDRQVRHGQAAGHDGALLMIDLDNFKAVNDTLGHQAGDRLLTRVAEALRHNLRESDVIARLGGDEFAVILRRGDRRTAEVVAHKLVNAVAAEGGNLWASTEQIVLDAPGHGVTASIGIVLFDGRGGRDLVHAADLALYEVKRRGRNGFAVST